MANVAATVRRIRRARRAPGRDGAERAAFETYREEYEAILAAMDDTCGDVAVEELAAWTIDWTHESGELPAPKRLRAKARSLCSARDIAVPETLRSDA